MRVVPSSRLPWNWFGVTMRSPSAPLTGEMRSIYQPDLPFMSPAEAVEIVRAPRVGGFVLRLGSCSAVIERCFKLLRVLVAETTCSPGFDGPRPMTSPYQVCVLLSLKSDWVK